MAKAHTQSCPVAASLNEVGDGWTLMIVREALNGTSRFKHFRTNTGIAKNMLADRLARMVLSGILEKREIQDLGAQHEYLLTKKGKALAPLIVAMTQWGNTWVYGEGKEPNKLVNRKSGDAIVTLMPHDKEGHAVEWKDVMMELGPGADAAMRARFARPNHNTSENTD